MTPADVPVLGNLEALVLPFRKVTPLPFEDPVKTKQSHEEHSKF